MTDLELELLRRIAPTGSTFAPEGSSGLDRQAFRVLVRHVRSLMAQGLVVADFLMPEESRRTEPLLISCSLTELGQLAVAGDRLTAGSISYTVDHEARIVRVTARGTITAADHVRHVRGLAASGLFGYHRLADYRDAFVDTGPQDLQRVLQVVHQLRRGTQPARTAFVTANDTFYGMLRMYEALAVDPAHVVRVFLDLGEAEAWLGCAVPQAR
ncbi:MAG TPA: hypothetical protein VF046_12235 [Gemmatimonadales bacterium]